MAWDDLPPDGSTFVAGMPGTSKSFVLMKIFDSRRECGIFINPRRKRYSIGPYISKFDDNAIALFNQTGRFVIDTSDISEVEEMLEYFHKVWDLKNGCLRCYIDEAPGFAPMYERGTVLEKLFAEWRNEGLLGVSIQQLLTNQTSTNIRKCSQARLIMTLDIGEYETFAKAYGLPENAPLYHYYRYQLASLYICIPHGIFPEITYEERPIFVAKTHFGNEQPEENHDRDNPQPGESNPAVEVGPPAETATDKTA